MDTDNTNNTTNTMSFNAEKFMSGKKRQATVSFPSDLSQQNSELWGYHIEDSNYYNVLGTCKPANETGLTDATLLGHLYESKPDNLALGSLTGYFDNGEIKFADPQGKECILEPVQLKIDLFSRNTGILESAIMLQKGAVIVGCGSVGSLVALELARAGVGRFFLIDMDIMGYHNICRHQCGLRDVGKYKTEAVKERILQINPSAKVMTARKRIQDVPFAELEPFCSNAIIVCCADNREGDLYADKFLAKPFGMPLLSIGCWERAFAGEIFYTLPEGTPTYEDLMKVVGHDSGRVNANTHLYMGEVGTFEPGISVDINFVTTIAVKMALDLLNRDNEGYTQRLLPHLTEYTLVCNTNNPKIGGDRAELFPRPLWVTNNLSINVSKR